MNLKRPMYLLIVLSLVAMTFLASPQSVLAIPSECPSGYRQVAYYDWNNITGNFVKSPSSEIDIAFSNIVAPLEGGKYELQSADWSSPIYIMRVVISDGANVLPKTYEYDYPGVMNGTISYVYLQRHNISNVAFCVPVTPVTLASFTAKANRGNVTIDWKTATEIDTAGFLLYRSTTPDGLHTQVTGNLVAARGNEVTGASYRFTDNPGFGTFYYWLKNVDYSGQSAIHGPAVVKVLPPVRQPAYRPSLPGQ